LGFGGEAIPLLLQEIASGEKQKRPRNDIISLVGEGSYIFTNPKNSHHRVHKGTEIPKSFFLCDLNG